MPMALTMVLLVVMQARKATRRHFDPTSRLSKKGQFCVYMVVDMVHLLARFCLFDLTKNFLKYGKLGPTC